MPERPKVTQLEASIILLNELFVRSHYNQQIAQALHNPWEKWFNPAAHPLKPEDFSGDTLRSQSLIYSVNAAISNLAPVDPKVKTDRLKGILRLRFGIEDGTLHTLKDIGDRYKVIAERIRTAEGFGLRMLRHPAYSEPLLQFIP